MATYKIGDRVRIRYSVNFPWLAGQEGVIVGTFNWRCTGDNREEVGLFYEVHPSCGLDGCFAPDESQIEPIQPTPTAADILAMENLPEGDCRAPEVVTVGAQA